QQQYKKPALHGWRSFYKTTGPGRVLLSGRLPPLDSPSRFSFHSSRITNMATERPPIPAHRPYIPPEAAPREFTARTIIVGVLLGIVFGASSLYLVLKVSLTVSASIPVAVISLALFRLWSKFG